MTFNQEDSYRHKGLRAELITLLRSKGITNESILEAMNNVPRHFFFDPALDYFAYEDRAFPIAAEQTISQPYTVAYQTQLLKLEPYHKVLEIGTGSGYQACILAQLGAQVFTIERQRVLFDKNQKFAYLKKFRHLKLFYGDGFLGLPKFGPFDAILITAAAPYVPIELISQLKIGGRLVLPLGSGDVQTMQRITRISESDTELEEFSEFSFVPMLKGKNN